MKTVRNDLLFSVALRDDMLFLGAHSYFSFVYVYFCLAQADVYMRLYSLSSTNSQS